VRQQRAQGRWAAGGGGTCGGGGARLHDRVCRRRAASAEGEREKLFGIFGASGAAPGHPPTIRRPIAGAAHNWRVASAAPAFSAARPPSALAPARARACFCASPPERPAAAAPPPGRAPPRSHQSPKVPRRRFAGPPPRTGGRACPGRDCRRALHAARHVRRVRHGRGRAGRRLQPAGGARGRDGAVAPRPAAAAAVGRPVAGAAAAAVAAVAPRLLRCLLAAAPAGTL
jgi:hypothetical protein